MFPRSSRLLAVALVALAALGDAAIAQPTKPDFPSASPLCTLKQRVGFTDIEITYSRPSVRGRKIFGGLEPFGEIWRTGANSSTTIAFSTAVKFNGKEIPAGIYELFSIPGETEWTVILHKNLKEWGAYSYKEQDDVARVTAKPVALAEPVETFIIDLNDIRDDSATLNLIWEKTRVPVKLEFDVTDKVVRDIDEVMASDAAKKPYFQAALFYLEHNLDLTKAKAWMEQAVKAQPDAFWVYYHQARLLAKMGDKSAALASARRSVELAKKVDGAVGSEYSRLNETLISTLQ